MINRLFSSMGRVILSTTTQGHLPYINVQQQINKSRYVICVYKLCFSCSPSDVESFYRTNRCRLTVPSTPLYPSMHNARFRIAGHSKPIESHRISFANSIRQSIVSVPVIVPTGLRHVHRGHELRRVPGERTRKVPGIEFGRHRDVDETRASQPRHSSRVRYEWSAYFPFEKTAKLKIKFFFETLGGIQTRNYTSARFTPFQGSVVLVRVYPAPFQVSPSTRTVRVVFRYNLIPK